MSPNLTGGSFVQWSAVVDSVLDRARLDHNNNRRRRSGRELRALLVGECRNRHIRLLSYIYNQYRDELRDAGK